MPSKIIKVLNGETVSAPPVWFMQQAGWHLPEYLDVRATAKDFIDFCVTPDVKIENMQAVVNHICGQEANYV